MNRILEAKGAFVPVAQLMLTSSSSLLKVVWFCFPWNINVIFLFSMLFMNFAYSSLALIMSYSTSAPSWFCCQSVGGSMLILACWKFFWFSFSRGIEQIGAFGSSFLNAV